MVVAEMLLHKFQRLSEDMQQRMIDSVEFLHNKG